jgi:sulfatase maturation enzyme AslB (radical SAM superfamily)
MTFHQFKMTTFNIVRHPGRFGLPTGIGLETSTACNRRCPYCPQSVEPMKQQIVSKELWETFLFRLREFKWRGVVSVTSYNEFSLIPNSDQYIRDISELGCLPLLFSNGDRPQVVESWVKAGARRILITEHPPFKQEWVDAILPIVKRYPRVMRLRRLDNSVLHSHAGRVPYGIKPYTRCDSQKAIVVGVKGNVGLCCLDYGVKYNFGSIVEKSFQQIWFEPEYVKLRQDISDGNPRTDLCKGCFGLTPAATTPAAAAA